jgi:acyl carrier protein
MNSPVTREQILSRLQAVFDRVFLVPVSVRPELSAADVEEWDSLLQISIIVAVEETFGIRFRVGEVESAVNVGEFADLIKRRIEESVR